MDYITPMSDTLSTPLEWGVTTEIIGKPQTEVVLASTCERYKFAVAIISGLVCIFGIVGNVLSLAVLRRLALKTGKSTSTILLSTLAMCDILVLGSFFVLKAMPGLCSYRGLCLGLFDVYMTYAIYGWACVTLFHCVSTWLTVLLSIHRYIAVCYPLRAVTWGSPTRVRIHIALVIFLSVIYELPTFLGKKMVPYKTDGNITKYYEEKTSLGKSSYYHIVYKIVFYYTIIYLVPVTMMVVLGSLLIRTLGTATIFRNKAQHDSNSQESGINQRRSSAKDDITKIMIVIIAVHLITQPWEPVRYLLVNAFNVANHCGSFLYFFDELPVLLASVNSAVNFLVYCLVGRQFRSVLKEIFMKTTKEFASGGQSQNVSTTSLRMDGVMN